MLQNNRHVRPGGDTGKSLGAKHFQLQARPSIVPPAAGLDLTLGEVLDDPSDSSKTRIPRRWKCSRRVCPMHPLKGDEVDNGVSCRWARNKDANLFLIIVRSGFEILFADANLGIQTIFFWREDADELVIVCAGWKIGHVEVYHHFITIENFRIDVSPSLVRLLPIGFILEWNKEVIAEDGLEYFQRAILSIELKTKLSVPDITLIHPFVRQKGGIIFRVVDIEDIPFNWAGKKVLGIKGKVLQAFEMLFLIRCKG